MSVEAHPAVVATTAGRLQGTWAERAGVAVFRGVPFAAPPVGERRWREPEPAEAWDGVRSAVAFGADCPQAPYERSRANRMDEDCLTLNIWTPAVDRQAKLPVLVWFYGGSFLFGSASDPRSDGAELAARGAVVVTANYRVGLFGFLAHPGLSAASASATSGNYGLADNLAALRWVQDNIEAFGGDPGRVTPFGVSAGSASLGLLMTSPAARGLFSRMILQSPGAFRPLAPLADAEAAGLALGPDIEALRSLDASEVLARTALLAPKVRSLTSHRVLRPIRDGVLVPADDRVAFGTGRFHAVPTLVGGMVDEGSKLVAAWPHATVADWDELVAANFGTAAAEVAQHYRVANDADVAGRVAELFGDTQFTYGARGIARGVAARGVAAYRYLFTRRAGRGDGSGPHHGDCVPYVFGGVGRGDSGPYDEADAALAERIGAAWVRFAATGDPNGAGLSGWAPYDPEADSHYELGDRCGPGSGWRRGALDFLDRFYEYGSPSPT